MEKKWNTFLELEGKRYFEGSRDKAELEKTAMNLQNNHPEVEFVIWPFFVKITKIDLETSEVTDWKQEDGFSLWYSPVDAFHPSKLGL